MYVFVEKLLDGTVTLSHSVTLYCDWVIGPTSKFHPGNPRWICGAHLKEISTKNSAATPLKVNYPKPAILIYNTSIKSNKTIRTF